jgi:MYXO-CTERM domain-containing protein
VKKTFVVVVPAVVAAALAHDAAANPPPPKVLPDPPISAPAKDEAPTVVRKHEGVCYAFYPAGGTLPVKCPVELIPEPLGEAILKNPSGRCQFIPFQSGGPGRAGYVDKCPAIFAEVGKAGVIPEAATKMLQELSASKEKADEPWVEPPQPARLDTTAPQQVGCGGCAASSGAPHGAIAAIAGLAVLALRRRRGKSTFPRHGEPDRNV